ncbi:galactose-3-O-sulfotransferase 4-like [Lytechinus pictus]|uniref:galactose-3-O-sulfotransferase 4-like n=1 Tax=Lytechinus pictus TaxID=7653 RepID=UPI0030BA0C83
MSQFFLKNVLQIFMAGAITGVFLLLFRRHAGIRQFERNYDTEESGREHSEESTPSRRECTRKNNIGFFKMHKCGSSTLQNVLMRYGDRYNLNFVLPWRSNVFSQTHLRLSMDLVKSFPVHDYNILCHHTRYSKEGFDSLLPADSTYVTIIRDPTTLFESLYTYFRYDECFGVPLETFLENPQQYDRSHSFGDTDTGCYAKDSMLFELGLDDTEKADPKVIEEMIHRTASEFELVMIMEYFSESLILLKELMCWDLEDVSYFVVNGRATSFINKLSDVTAERIRKWNNGNTELYRFFNETFWRKVK